MSQFECSETIQLNESEDKLFQFLRSLVESEENVYPTTMRVAGGWVRDKLMGLDADDIDISLDNMSGAEFGELIKQSQRAKQPSNNKKKPVSVIEIRPEMGKFVETATVSCMGFSLDLLSLRSQIQLGEKLKDSSDTLETDVVVQAAEDAHLRDFTINALFYNVNTGLVEDFVGGVRDLKNKIIRCPNSFDAEYFSKEMCSDDNLELEGTLLRLKEDPLRIIRAIRFSAKYGYVISPSIEEVACKEEVKLFLLHHTTNERILTETTKVYLYPVDQALYGLKKMAELEIMGSIYPMACSLPKGFWGIENSSLYFSCCKESLAQTVSLHVPQNVVILASYFFPSLGHHIYPNGATHIFPFTKEHMKETWKFSAKNSSDVLDIMNAAAALKEFKDEYVAEGRESFEDAKIVVIGRLLRATKEKWIHALHIAQALEISIHIDKRKDIVQQYQKFHDALSALGFDGLFGATVWGMRPMFTGKEMITQFGVKPGKRLGAALEILVDWQFLHMDSSVEEGRQFLTNYLDNNKE